MGIKTPKSPVASPQGVPPSHADVAPPYRGNDYKFEVQSLYEIQKTLGSLIASVEALKASSDISEVKQDIREIKINAGTVKDDLHSAKIWILGLFGAGFIALLVVFSVGYLRLSDHEEKVTSVMSDMRVSIQQLVDAIPHKKH